MKTVVDVVAVVVVVIVVTITGTIMHATKIAINVVFLQEFPCSKLYLS